jgi:hypothetical protein
MSELLGVFTKAFCASIIVFVAFIPIVGLCYLFDLLIDAVGKWVIPIMFFIVIFVVVLILMLSGAWQK